MTSSGLSACICDDWNQLGLVIASACKHPGRRLLIEERPERRDEREQHQHAQHGAHAVDRLVGMLAARAFELQPHADAAEAEQRHQREASRDHEAERRDEQERPRAPPPTPMSASDAAGACPRPARCAQTRRNECGFGGAGGTIT